MDMGEDGVRWPEKVALRGEAKETREWSVEYRRRQMGGNVMDRYRELVIAKQLERR